MIGIGRIAAPALIDKPSDDTGAQRIIMNVIAKLHQVLIIFNQNAFIAALPPARRAHALERNIDISAHGAIPPL